jgi:hypothetical protein
MGQIFDWRFYHHFFGAALAQHPTHMNWSRRSQGIMAARGGLRLLGRWHFVASYETEWRKRDNPPV